jgi:hypothetical protein
LQRRRRIKIDIREIFGIARFSTFATWGNSGIEPDKGEGRRTAGRKDRKASADENRWGMSTAAMEKKIKALHRSGMGMLRMGRELGAGTGFDGLFPLRSDLSALGRDLVFGSPAHQEQRPDDFPAAYRLPAAGGAQVPVSPD